MLKILCGLGFFCAEWPCLLVKRTAGDEVTYPDIDLELKAGLDGVRGFHRKDGTPYPRAARD